jgi:hypothetical protein
MEIPSILLGHSRTRLLQVIAMGAVAALVIGFSWGGWVTDTKAPSAAEIVQFDFNSLAGTKAESMASAAEASGKEVRGAADAKGNNR